MKTLRIAFFLLLFLVGSTSTFALGFFGGSSADCDGDGKNDISCSGATCISLDEGVIPGIEGYCECTKTDGTKDTKKCSDRPTITVASYLNSSEIWLELFPLGADTPTAEESEPAPAKETDLPHAAETVRLSQGAV